MPGLSSSTPPSHGRSALGTYTEPSARWCTSSRQAIVRAIAQSVPFSVAAGWGLPSASRNRMFSRRAWNVVQSDVEVSSR
jgi:hypothetical protein